MSERTRWEQQGACLWGSEPPADSAVGVHPGPKARVFPGR